MITKRHIFMGGNTLGQCPLQAGVSDMMRAPGSGPQQCPLQAAAAAAAPAAATVPGVTPIPVAAPAPVVAPAPAAETVAYTRVAPPPPPVATPQAQALSITSESSPIEDLLSFGSIAGIVYLTLDLFDLV